MSLATKIFVAFCLLLLVGSSFIECEKDPPIYGFDPEKTRVIDICSKLPDTGKCIAKSIQWYYNPAKGKCKKFIHGGCGQSKNRFITEDDCKKQCAGPMKGIYPD